MSKSPFNLKREDWFRMAKIIDNEFIGADDYFRCERVTIEYWYLSTDSCDSTSFIRVYGDEKGLTRITVLGEYTDGYQDIHKHTLDRVNKYLAAVGCDPISVITPISSPRWLLNR